MNPLRSAHQVRLQLGARCVFQLTVATILFVTALFSGSQNGVLGLLVCLFGSSACAFFGIRNLKAFRNLGDYARAQKIQRHEITALRKSGWVQARQRKLPESCRGSVVMFTPEGDLAFVVGLSGLWPPREALVEPQRVAKTLERFGTPHIAVCLAAFVTGAEESFNYGVLAVSPGRFPSALAEAVESFRERQDRAFTGLVDRLSVDKHETFDAEVIA